MLLDTEYPPNRKRKERDTLLEMPNHLSDVQVDGEIGGSEANATGDDVRLNS